MTRRDQTGFQHRRDAGKTYFKTYSVANATSSTIYNRLVRSLLALLLAVPIALVWAADQAGEQHNMLTEAERQQGWTLLFDGKTMDHWLDPRQLSPKGDAWTIEDGCLKAVPKPRITEDLVSREAYSDFELKWQWKIDRGSNSGVKYRIQALPVLTESTVDPKIRKFERMVDYAVEHNAFDRAAIGPNGHGQIYVIGFEYQLIDNAVHPDARRGPFYQAAAVYGILPPSEDATKPVGEFNDSVLIVHENHVEHWLNGKKVIDAQLDPPLLKETMLKRWGEASPVYKLLIEQPKKHCPISLQNHGDPAWFRDIKIRRF